ncbi:MAG TPA: helix-hairpin-helix domain-containing protein [Xanthobacteraceae bacterium]|nr:helix-hairpin-helix domain-containing protein [Xanthobacteraceae bacterium]
MRSTDLKPGDDYAMMREMLTRRFRRLLAEAPRSDGEASTRPADRFAADGHEGFHDRQQPSAEPTTDAAMTAAAPRREPLAAIVERADVADGADIAEDDTHRSPWPDLVLIDGGLGQLNAARDTLAALGVTDIPLVAIAKGPDRDAGRETFFTAGRSPFMLRPRDPVLYFVERLRDEAHRFAIGSHRQKRKRDIREAGLQEIPGIGPARKRALLRHFGTLRAIERASVADLEHVAGINAETARKVYDFFHEAPR